MEKIKLLAPEVVNKIHAGELVARPASVVKELVENSIDSGATEIKVMVENGGITSLAVTDNGSGMGPQDICLAVQPHATSKLTRPDDLEEIGTYGFRGEALSSISSVSKMTVRSRRAEDEEGRELKLRGSYKDEVPVPCVMPHGTEIIVRDIFHHVPARRKHLRQPRTEWAKCDDEIQGLAIGNSGVSVSFGRDGQIRKHWEAKETKERVFEVFGQKFAENAREIRFDRGPISIHGFIDPDSIGHRSRQLLYINGRKVNVTTLRHAIKRSCTEAMMIHDPLYVIFITMPGQLVDVNAHPSKIEVRLKEPRAMYALMHDAVEKIARMPLGVNPYLRVGKGEKGASASNISEKTLGDMFGDGSSGVKMDKEQPEAEQASIAGTESKKIPQSLGRVVGMLHGIYLLTENEDGMVVIDVHAAHERIILEELKSARKVKSQALTSPIELSLSPTELDTVSGHREVLADAGLILENRGGLEFLLSVPAMTLGKDDNPVSLVMACINDLILDSKVHSVDEFSDRILATIACHAAVRGSNPFLTNKNLDVLLKKMEYTLGSGKCNHGRPCWQLLSMAELDSSFKRGR